MTNEVVRTKLVGRVREQSILAVEKRRGKVSQD